MALSSEPARTEAPSHLRVPEFFIVGHHKSGTTALYEMLRGHPQIFMPAVKEPRFFDSDLHALTGSHAASGLPRTFEQYLALFSEAEPGQRLGEASPSYLRSTAAAGAIAAVQPNARCIAILREPASFVRSLHLQLVQEHVETEKDLRAAIANEQIVRAGRQVRRYSDHVHYVDQLRRYHEALPPEQVLVLIYDDFRRENEETVRRVLRFLEVDDAVAIEVKDANPTVSVRSLRADQAVSALYGGGGTPARALKGAVRALTPSPLRRAALRTIRRRLVYGQPEPVDEELVMELRRRYKPEVVALSEYLDRDLEALWGYGGLD